MSEGIALTSRLRIATDVVFHDLQGEMVLLNLKTGVYFGLDAIGTAVWRLLEGGRSVGELLDALVAEYEVAERRCEADLVEFLGALRDNALVSLDDPPA